jgi:hypothetical protein
VRSSTRTGDNLQAGPIGPTRAGIRFAIDELGAPRLSIGPPLQPKVGSNIKLAEE